MNLCKWASLDEVNQHHSRQWLQQMYIAIEDQHLLDGYERITYLTLISDFLYS